MKALLLFQAFLKGEKNIGFPLQLLCFGKATCMMAGRMIGHSSLHGGFGVSGISFPVVTLLTGGSTNTAVSALTLLDSPDLETIGFST